MYNKNPEKITVQKLIHVRPGHPQYVGTLPNTLKSAGTFIKWRTAVNEFICDQPKMQALLSFAAGSYLRGLKGFELARTPMICMHSNECTGKTAMLGMIQSIQQDGRYFMSGSSDVECTENMLMANNNGFLCQDDMTLDVDEKKRNLAKLLMRIANGVGSRKNKKVSWESTIFYASWESINNVSRNSVYHKDLLSCSIDFDFSNKNPGNFFSGKGCNEYQKLRSTLNDNYGTAYEKIINFISHDSNIGLIEMVNTGFMIYAYELLAPAELKAKNVFMAKAKYYAMAASGCFILKGIGVDVDFKRVNDVLIEMLLSDKFMVN